MTRFLLAIVVRFLPDEQWRRAMTAELAALDHGRWRFVLGCTRAVLFSGAFAGRVAGYALIGTALALLATPSGGNQGWFALVFGALLLDGTGAIARRPAAVAATSGIAAVVWWGGLLFSETVREHPQWALLVIALSAAAAGWRGGPIAAAGSAFATCLAIFVVAVGTYAVRPDLAPDVVPANAVNPRVENRIESSDPYIGEILLAAVVCLGLTGAGLVAARRELPG